MQNVFQLVKVRHDQIDHNIILSNVADTKQILNDYSTAMREKATIVLPVCVFDVFIFIFVYGLIKCKQVTLRLLTSIFL